MIRRLFWMTAGALLGVTGYRRVSRLARAVAVSPAHLSGRRGGRTHAGWAGSVALFARDVCDGMDLYLDQARSGVGRSSTHRDQLARDDRRARKPT